MAFSPPYPIQCLVYSVEVLTWPQSTFPSLSPILHTSFSLTFQNYFCVQSVPLQKMAPRWLYRLSVFTLGRSAKISVMQCHHFSCSISLILLYLPTEAGLFPVPCNFLLPRALPVHLPGTLSLCLHGRQPHRSGIILNATPSKKNFSFKLK